MASTVRRLEKKEHHRPKKQPQAGTVENLDEAREQTSVSDAYQQVRQDSTAVAPQTLLQLQRSLGNSAVNRLLAQRDKKDPPAATATATAEATPETPALPSAEELTERIARCIGIWETNRGKDDPDPKESSLDTVAGVHASMATIEQATMSYAITALKKYKTLRDSANPPLTLKELNAADARCVAVNTLLASVATAAAAGTTAEDFIKANGTAISATGLENDDVTTMFDAVTLKSTIDAAHTRVEAEKTKKDKDKKLDDEVSAIAEEDRLGLGASSVKAYIRKPSNWGEHKAGWHRKAVNAMADDVGGRIESVSTSSEGTALATPVVRGRVDTELAKNPVPSEEDIVKTVAQKNNPGEAEYGKHVWETYDRLY